jgi:hypothetical protein
MPVLDSWKSAGAAARGMLAVLLLGVAASVARAAPAVAPAEPGALPPERTEFILGNVVFVMLHEFGHAVIRDFNVPILGLEENSADTLAAVTLIRAERLNGGGDGAFSYSRLLGMAAVGNLLTWRSGVERVDPELAYWAQHDLSSRRAARSLCLLVGGEPGQFGWLAASGEVPEIRAENCADEYALAEYAVIWVGRTYGRFADGRAVDDGREIRVQYFDTRTPVQARLLKPLRDGQVIEKVASFYDRAFRFPEPLTVRLLSCGTPNAYWDPDLRQLQFCYELLETLDRISVDPAVTRAYDLFRQRATIRLNEADSSPPGAKE